MTHFNKPPLTADQQLDLLADRGLHINDRERARRLLEVTTLFRLSPYMRPFQYADDHEHRFRPGSQLADIVYIYRFDSDLRQLVMVGIERIEVAVRACISNHMAPRYGTHWYLDRRLFKRAYKYERLLADLAAMQRNEIEKYNREAERIRSTSVDEVTKAERLENRKRDNYARYYSLTYSEPSELPSWAMLEELSFGALSHLYGGLAKDRDRKVIARRFGVPHGVLVSWLHTLTFVRNVCAHHSRLWNRELAISPKWPERLPGPNGRASGGVSRRVFTVLMLLVYLTREISPDTRWPGRLQALLKEYRHVPLQPMGFTTDWEERLWLAGT